MEKQAGQITYSVQSYVKLFGGLVTLEKTIFICLLRIYQCV